MTRNAYKTLSIILGISLILMYSIMFLNVDNSAHVYLSLTRLYISVLMVTPMAVLMLFLMPEMFKNKKNNAMIVSTSALVFIVTLFLLRTQTPIADIQYMKAMIPHHSSAILTSKYADIQDPEVKNLSLQIIESQEQEIAQMKRILERMEE